MGLRSLAFWAGGSNPAESLDICFLWVFSVVRCDVYKWVWLRSLYNEEALKYYGLLRHGNAEVDIFTSSSAIKQRLVDGILLSVMIIVMKDKPAFTLWNQLFYSDGKNVNKRILRPNSWREIMFLKERKMVKVLTMLIESKIACAIYKGWRRAVSGSIALQTLEGFEWYSSRYFRLTRTEEATRYRNLSCVQKIRW